MARKEHIPTTRISETIYVRHYGKEKRDSESVTIYVEYAWYRPNVVDVLFNECSETCLDYYGDSDIERYIHVRGDAVKKLADKFTAKDANTLLRRMADRFRSYGWDAYKQMTAWLEQKGIEYTTSIY